MSIVDQTSGMLTLSGNGILSGNGFDATATVWTFSAQGSSSYSMVVSAATSVSAPGPLVVLGIGLIGIVGRKHIMPF